MNRHQALKTLTLALPLSFFYDLMNGLNLVYFFSPNMVLFAQEGGCVRHKCEIFIALKL